MVKRGGFFSGSKVKPQEEVSKMNSKMKEDDDDDDVPILKNEAMDINDSMLSDDEADFVPDSLVKFFAKAKAELDDTEELFCQLDQSAGGGGIAPSESMEGSDVYTMVEDDQDLSLKKDIMDKYKHELFSPQSDCAVTPPANPAANVTYSQAKRMALASEEKDFMSPKVSYSMEPLHEAFEVEANLEQNETEEGAFEEEEEGDAFSPDKERRAAAFQAEMARALAEEKARKRAEAAAEERAAREAKLAKAREAELARAAAKEEARKRAAAREAEQARAAAEDKARKRAAARQAEMARAAAEEEARKRAEAAAEAQRRAAARQAEMARAAKEAEAKKRVEASAQELRQAAAEKAEMARAEEARKHAEAAAQEHRKAAALEAELARAAAEEEAEARKRAEAELARAAEEEARKRAEAQAAAAAQAKIREAEERRAAAAEAKRREEEEMKAAAVAVAEAKNLLNEQSLDLAAFLPPTVKEEAFQSTQTTESAASKPSTSENHPKPTAMSTLRARQRASVPAKKPSVSSKQVAARPVRKPSTRPSASTFQVTSRLTKSTAASRAHASPPVKPQVPKKGQSTGAPSRLTRSTAASRACMSPPAKAKSKRQDPEADSRDPASVRRRKLEQKSPSYDADKAAAEAQARAKERIRQHRLKHQKANGTQRLARPRTGATSERKRRVPHTTRTIGRSPPLTTRAMHGTKVYSASGTHSGAALDVNPITAASGSPTHGFTASQSVPSAKPTLTVPKPFHFHETKSSSKPSTPARVHPSDGMTLGESMEMLTRKGFRDLNTPSAPVRRDGRLTVPKSPRLSEGHKRALPKSTAEKEEEVMEYYRSHPFRAQPVMADSYPSTRGVPKVPKRRITTPEPFHLRSEERSAKAMPPESFIKKIEEEDLKECKKQFHALPMPKFKPSAPSMRTKKEEEDSEEFKGFYARPMPSFDPPPPRPKSKPTTPEPFHLSATPKSARSEARKAKNPDDVELSKQFHARPVPKTTFAKPSPPKRSPTTRSATGTPLNTLPGPPKLASATRSEKRHAAAEASRKNAEAVSAEKKRMALRRQKERHMEEMAKATESPLRKTKPTPFHLESDKRHEVFAKRMEAQLKMEREEEKRRTEFRAARFKASPPPTPRPKRRVSTEPRPFKLRTNVRHAHNQRVIKEKLEEESKQSSTHFKANPVPKTTYRPAKPITPKKQPLITPFSPRLASMQRAKQRQEYDDLVEKERELEAAQKQLLEERRRMEEERELQEKRRLPASEGGFNPSIEPINAVLEKQHAKAKRSVISPESLSNRPSDEYQEFESEQGASSEYQDFDTFERDEMEEEQKEPMLHDELAAGEDDISI